MAIKTLDEFLATIPNDDNRARMVEVLNWVAEHYPELELRVAWNQPMWPGLVLWTECFEGCWLLLVVLRPLACVLVG